MKTIAYETGRTYDAKQVLLIDIESESIDEFGIREIVATFKDDSRHIKGRVNTLVFNDGVGASVLCAYDAGQYESI
jgi:hypothetical protein